MVDEPVELSKDLEIGWPQKLQNFNQIIKQKVGNGDNKEVYYED